MRGRLGAKGVGGVNMLDTLGLGCEGIQLNCCLDRVQSKSIKYGRDLHD